MRLRTSPSIKARSPAGPVPGHVAIIMDGNGRWAQRRGQPRLEGHRAGTENIRRVVRAFGEHRVEYVTLFAFSTENWGRPRREVRGLLRLLAEVIYEETRALHAEGVRIRHLGRLDRLAPRLRQAICEALELTRNNTGVTLCVAFDYGGRAEILDAVRNMLRDGVVPEGVTEELFHRHLYIADIPDPDLIIRTAGERRLSNFLLWQSAYSEYYCTPVLWPDFDQAEVARALREYRRRRRRFGRIPPEE